MPVLDGHLLCVSLRLQRAVSPVEVAEELDGFRGRIAGLDLPSAPDNPITVLDHDEPPTPRRHAGAGGGMTVTVGRIDVARYTTSGWWRWSTTPSAAPPVRPSSTPS